MSSWSETHDGPVLGSLRPGHAVCRSRADRVARLARDDAAEDLGGPIAGPRHARLACEFRLRALPDLRVMARPSAPRRIGPRPAVVLLGLLLAACATAPPERDSRHSTLIAAAAECAAGRPGLRVERVDPDGRVRVTVGPGGERDVPAFNACYAQKAQETLSRAQVTETRAAVNPAGGRPGAHVTSVPIRLVNRKVLVPVVLNGGPPATFVLDTGANITVVSPGLARSLGVEGRAGEPRG